MPQAENSRNSSPASPTTTEHGFNYGEPGMTLRDYFAAKAMQGCLTAKYASIYRPEAWAKDAYGMADAMLKARDHGAEGSENDRHVATFLLREALKSCLEYGAMTGADWVTDKARAALAKAGEPR